MNLPGPLPRLGQPLLPSRSESSGAEAPGTVDVAGLVESLRQTKESMRRLHRKLSEPLAIVGLGCRFPGAANPEQYWDLLQRGDQISSSTADRWDASLTASFDKQPGHITGGTASLLDQIDQFDAGFFGISGREAATLDPQQRLLLEVAWETFEHSGIDPDAWRGQKVGAFVGICANDYLHRLMQRDSKKIDTYLSTGNAHGAAAGRLSFVMDWRGPSVAIDTACSSSLTAVHLAARSLRYGECDLAIAMGVNIILAPELSISLSQAGMLSPTGRCHTFTSRADGFARGEGCGAVLLKRLGDAITDGDPILCVVRGSAANQDGRSIGLTAPCGAAQTAVIRDALADANLNPNEVDYVEAHGTGTPLGDPVEVDSLEKVFGATRTPERPLRVGSVKANLGHLEGAAGIAGVIKVAMSLARQQLPAHVAEGSPSPSINWNWPVELVRVRQPWPREAANQAVAGVSSFGFGGSNAHIILSTVTAADLTRLGFTPRQDATDEPSTNSGARLVVLSAKSESALRCVARNLAASLRETPRELTALARTLAVGRAHHDYRAAVFCDSLEDLTTQLDQLATEGLEASDHLANTFAMAHPWIQARHAYLAGESVAWHELFETYGPQQRCAGLPTYPFERCRRWFEDHDIEVAPNLSSNAGLTAAPTLADDSHSFKPSLLGKQLDLAGNQIVFETRLDGADEWFDHVVGGSPLMPASAYLELALQAGRVAFASSQVGVADLELLRAIKLTRDPLPRLQIQLKPDTDLSPSDHHWRCSVAVHEANRWHTAATCRLQSNSATHDSSSIWLAGELPIFEVPADAILVNASTHYAIAESVGLGYREAFRGLIQRWTMTTDESSLAEGHVACHSGLAKLDYAFSPAWLDACFQVAASLMNSPSSLWLPIAIERYDCHRSPAAGSLAQVQAVRHSGDDPADCVTISLRVFDQHRQLLASIERMRLRELNLTTKADETARVPASHALEPATVLEDAEHSVAINMDRATLCEYLHERVADIMGLTRQETPINRPLNSLGLDSLMAFEFRDELERNFKIQVPLELFFESITLEEFIDGLSEQILQSSSALPPTDDWVEGAI